MQRSPAYIDWVTRGINPPLKNVSCSAAKQAADQADKRDAVMMKSNCLRKLLNRKWGVRVHLAVAGRVCCFGRNDGIVHVVELSHQSVDSGVLHRSWTSSAWATLTSACGNKVFNSEIETAGSTRRNKNMHAEKKPSVPIKIAQSNCVG